MDAGSLAVIMSPNLTGPPQNILVNNTLKTHTAIVRILIENSYLIGCVPPDVEQSLESHSLESVLGCEGGEDDERVEPAERNQKRRKHRTVSISGELVCVICECVICEWVICVWVWQNVITFKQ